MSEFKNLFLGLKQPRNEDVLYFPTLRRAVAIMTFQDFILSLMVNSACSNIFWPFLKFENSYHFCSILCWLQFRNYSIKVLTVQLSIKLNIKQDGNHHSQALLVELSESESRELLVLVIGLKYRDFKL